MGILDVPGLSRARGDQLYASRDVSELIQGRFPRPDERKLLGPLAAGNDLPTVTPNAAPSGAYTRVYAVSANTPPADWPVDSGEAPVNIQNQYIRSEPQGQARLQRIEMDGPRLALKTENLTPGGDAFLLWVNGAPYSLDLTLFGPTDTFTTIEFAGPAVRSIEILTTASISAVYTSAPYRLWKPPPAVGPLALLMGDSYSAGVTIDAAAPATTQSPRMNGFAARAGLHLGIDRWMTDGVGGTGAANDGGGWGTYLTRLQNWMDLELDAFIAGGGGSNDFYNDFATMVEVVDAYVELYGTARDRWAGAKLGFFEGFSPPNGFATFGPKYIELRQTLQTELAGVGVYYFDIATSSAWIDGTGYKGATTGVGNSDIYIGGDGIHFTTEGGDYILGRLIPKLRAMFADNGELLNTLI